MIPDGVDVRITRNYGETANEKVNELVEDLGVAIVIVIGLIAFRLGWREALIVAVGRAAHLRADAARQLSRSATRSTA